MPGIKHYPSTCILLVEEKLPVYYFVQGKKEKKLSSHCLIYISRHPAHLAVFHEEKPF